MDVHRGPLVILFLGVALMFSLIIRKLTLFGIAEGKGVIPETAGDISKGATGSRDE